VRAGLKVRFHMPNALHIRKISPAMARLMKQAGFETPRLGLGTTAFETRRGLNRKVAAADPIFTNNAIMPCQAEPFTWERLTR
jgi:hypothetical protein